MSKEHIDRFEIITRLSAHEINGTEAAELLNLSVRQVKRLKVKVHDRGIEGLKHGNMGKAGNNRLPEKTKKKIKKLLKKHYSDFGPTFATEKLSECHNITHDPKTIRQIMIDEELWKPKINKTAQTHRAWRERRSAYGEMQQFDGCYHHWFENRGGELCLLGAIDDATGKITKLQFAPHEGVIPVMTFWKEYQEVHGKPRAIYLDKFSTYNMNHKLATENADRLTQFERACQELHIELIKANSPQAKGRIERLWDTLQDRLVKELRLAGINTIPEANIFVEKIFIKKFNIQFNVEPKLSIDLHRKLTDKEKSDLVSILSRQYERTIQNDFTFSFNTQWFQLTEKQPVTVCKKDKVIIEERIDASIHVRLKGRYLNYIILPQRPKKSVKTPWILPATGTTTQPHKAHTPASDHPWKKSILLEVKKREFNQV